MTFFQNQLLLLIIVRNANPSSEPQHTLIINLEVTIFGLITTNHQIHKLNLKLLRLPDTIQEVTVDLQHTQKIGRASCRERV